MGCREFFHQRVVMGRDDDRCPGLVQFLEQVHQTHGNPVIDIAGGFIGQQAVFGRLMTARAIATRCCCPPDRVEGRASSRSPRPTQLRSSRTWVSISAVRAPPTRNGKRHILDSGQVVDQPEILKHDADLLAQFGQFCARGHRDIPVEDMWIEAACGTQGEIHQLEEGRFSRTTGPGQEVERSRARV
jgi:hypothetical protein